MTDNRAHHGTATGQVLSIRVTVNGHAHDVLIEPYLTLIELIRDRLGLTGTKKSCDMQVCGACTVLLNGRPVSACTMLAFEARNAALLTIEGMAQGDASHSRSLHRARRVAMRLLHARDDPGGEGFTGRESRTYRGRG